jgi:flagellar biosynthesis protein FlhF
VGPPGAGKTTTLVKLAVAYGLAARRSAVLLSMDTHRIAAAEQLRSYAVILGLGCEVLETPAALARAIEESGSKDLIFIDTPGLAGGEMDHAADLARFLATRRDVDTHLVLPASMKSADMARAAETYEIFAPQKLLFTKLDESSQFGPVLNHVVRSGKPVSFFTGGQRIPEDLQAATPRRLLELVLAGHGKECVAAAGAAA